MLRDGCVKLRLPGRIADASGFNVLTFEGQMDFNFFEWIREGVKRSVLLGVSDAVETMGAPHDPEQSRDKIMSFLQEENSDSTGTSSRKRVAGSASGGQRKLGRSIADIHPTS